MPVPLVQKILVRHPDDPGAGVEVWVVKGRRNPWGAEYLICIPSHPDPDTATRFTALEGFADYVRAQVERQVIVG